MDKLRTIAGSIASSGRRISGILAAQPANAAGEASAQPAEPEAAPTNAPADPKAAEPNVGGEGKKRKEHAQTSKERREYARKRIMVRNQERKQEEEEKQPGDRPERTEPRLPKRKVALMLGFCGTDYQGMQVNPNARTIEGELFKAMCAAGAVSADNSTDQSKVNLQRAARTDKGVHAAGQVVSLKMIIEDPEIVQKINAHLPDQIRVWGYTRVMRSFNSKTMCDSRVYEYLLPTYVFMPPSEECARIADTVDFAERSLPETSDEELREKRAFRASPELLQYVRDAFGVYKGTHDFRNFTVTKGCTANNSKRFIHHFSVSDPMVIQGSEWLSLKVKGQSFMLHQIRKMVGLIILMARSNVPLKLIDILFGSARVNVPKAPGLGLLLEAPMFDGYNRRTSSQKEGTNGQVSFEPYRKEIDAFRQKYIYDNIVNTEVSERVFDEWVKHTEVYPEQYRYINKDCVIPESTIVVPGVSQPRPGGTAGNQSADSDSEVDNDDN
ncbi:tRNA pseudouridine synthase 1 [Coemansia sp. Cherry 401B]|nr:tRNA pseudouridine synthase 1 [Coemansia sp. Cherry 401B]